MKLRKQGDDHLRPLHCLPSIGVLAVVADEFYWSISDRGAVTDALPEVYADQFLKLPARK